MNSSKIHFANTLNLAKRLPRETVTIVRRLIKKSSTVLVIVALLLVASAQAETWTATGSMAFARRDHTTTLLTNGKVLIVGWFGVSPELYDPVTGTFSPTGNTVFAHDTLHTATRLLDGRVLVVTAVQIS